MDHAEVLDRLIEMAGQPGRLQGLDADTSPGSVELRGHLSTCSACRTELDAWRDAVGALDTAEREAPPSGNAPAGSLRALAESAGNVTLPPGLRDRTLAAIAESADATARARVAAPAAQAPAAPRPIRRGVARPLALLATAAVLALALVGGYAIVDRTQKLNQAQAETTALKEVAAGLDLILQDPAHQVAVLSTAAGASAGTVSWSTARSEVVVLASGLAAPPAGQTYRCWIDRNGSRVAVGEMWLAGSIAYWVGGMDAWSATFEPGGRFSVSLEPAAGGPGTVVLTANL
jgi:hypothetical protein